MGTAEVSTMPKRITNYDGCNDKTKIVIDYCALNKVVPRASDDGKIPGMRGVSSKEIAEDIRNKFGMHIAGGMPTWVYQRCGDRNHAPDFFMNHRQRLVKERVHQKW
jgi:hypothetical protein